MKTIEGGKTKVTHPNTNSHAKGLPSISGPKDTSGGMDLSGGATNCIGGKPHMTNAESPNSKAHSANQYKGMRG